MAGIFGEFRFDRGPVDRTLVARMSRTLAHRGPDGEGLACEDNWALGCRMLRATPESICESQPVQRASGTRLVFDGRLDNRDELIDQLRHHDDASAAMPDAELAAALYELSGPEFARHLLGDFALAVFDRRNQRVVLARDAIGIRPLYYRRTAASLSFASEIKALTLDPEVPTRPNDRLLAELLLRQLHRRDHDGSTLVEGLCEVPPAHVAIADVRRYWDFDGRSSANVRSFDDCADGFRDHFERAVRRRLRSTGPVAIAVSGGTDSSSIFSVAARRCGARPIGLSYSMGDGGPADESQFIADLERACELPIVPVDSPSPADPLFRTDELIRRVEAPMANAEWVRADRLVATAHQHGARTLLSGHWGDQLLFDQAYLVDFLHSGSWLAIASHLREYRRWFPEASGTEFTGRLAGDLLEYDVPRWVRGAVRGARGAWHKPAPWDDWFSPWFRSQAGPDVFSRELTPTPSSGSDVSVLARALYREVRSRYHVLCLDWQNKMAAPHAIERAFPFLDRDLIEFVMGVPGRMLARGGVPKALLRAAMNDRVPASILQRRAKGDFTAAVNAASVRASGAIAELLTRDPLVVQCGYVDAGKLRKGLASAAGALKQSRSSVASWRVTALVAFELWLRQFVENARSKREDREWRNISPVSAP
jgi:asparagine synthase (glutamine-hydrolysing)